MIPFAPNIHTNFTRPNTKQRQRAIPPIPLPSNDEWRREEAPLTREGSAQGRTRTTKAAPGTPPSVLPLSLDLTLHLRTGASGTAGDGLAGEAAAGEAVARGGAGRTLAVRGGTASTGGAGALVVVPPPSRGDVSYLRQRAGHGLAPRKGEYADVSLAQSAIPSEYHVVEKSMLPPTDPDLASHFDPVERMWVTTIFPAAKPTSRADVLTLARWCDYMLQKEVGFVDPSRYSSREELEEAESLIVRKSQKMWTIAFHELNRQVSLHCAERGELLERIFSEYFASTHRLQALAEAEKERAIRAVRDKTRREMEKAMSAHERSLGGTKDAADKLLAEMTSDRDKYVNFSNKLKTLLENRDNKLAHLQADLKYYEGKMSFVQKLLDEAEGESRRVRHKYGEDVNPDAKGTRDVYAQLAIALKDMKKGAPKEAVKVKAVDYDKAMNADEEGMNALAEPVEEKAEAHKSEEGSLLQKIHDRLDALKQDLDPAENFSVIHLMQEIHNLLKAVEAKVMQLKLAETQAKRRAARLLLNGGGGGGGGGDDDDDDRFEGEVIMDDAGLAATVNRLWDVLLSKKKRPLPKFCGNCPIEARAVMRCLDCREAFCTKCATSIHRIPIFRKHDVRPILDVLDEYLADVDELPEGWDPVEDARRAARKAAMEELDRAAIEAIEAESERMALEGAKVKKHTRIVYQLQPTELAKAGVDEEGVAYGDEEGPLGFAEAFLMDIGLYRDGTTITNRYWEPWVAKEVSDNNQVTMTFIDMEQIQDWSDHVCPDVPAERPAGKGRRFSDVDDGPSDEDEDAKAKRRNKALMALIGKKVKPTRRNAYSMVIPAKLLKIIEGIPEAEPIGQTKPLKWILRYIAGIYAEKITTDTIDDREGNPRQELREFVYDYHINRYGLPQLAEKQIIYFLHSVWQLKDVNSRVKLFAQFCGLYRPLPLKSLSFYLYVADTIRKVVEKSSAEAQVWLRPQDAEEERPTVQVTHVLDSFKLIFGRSTPAELSEFTLQLFYDLCGRNFRSSTRVSLDDVIEAVLQEWHRLRELFDLPVEALFYAADIDNDGVLSFEEFRRVLRLVFPFKTDDECLRMYKFGVLDTTVLVGLEGMSMESFVRQMHRYGFEHISTAPPMGRVGSIIAPTFEYLEISSRTTENDVQQIVNTLTESDPDRAGLLSAAYKQFRELIEANQRPDIAWCASMLLRNDVDFYRRKQKQYGGSYNQKELAKARLLAPTKKDGKDLKDVVSARYVAFGLSDKDFKEYKSLVFQRSSVKDAADKLLRTASIVSAFRGGFGGAGAGAGAGGGGGGGGPAGLGNGGEPSDGVEEELVGYFDADGNWIEERVVKQKKPSKVGAKASHARGSTGGDSDGTDEGGGRAGTGDEASDGEHKSPKLTGSKPWASAASLKELGRSGSDLSSNLQKLAHANSIRERGGARDGAAVEDGGDESFPDEDGSAGGTESLEGASSLGDYRLGPSAAAADAQDDNVNRLSRTTHSQPDVHLGMYVARLSESSPNLTQLPPIPSASPAPASPTMGPQVPPGSPGIRNQDLFRGASSSTGANIAVDRRKAMREAQQRLRSMSQHDGPVNLNKQ